MFQKRFNFNTAKIKNTLINRIILLSSSKSGFIKNFLPGQCQGAICGFTPGSSHPIMNYKNF